MAARKEMQLEKLIEEASRKKDFQLLEQFLATEDCENISHKCTKQFINKLDKLLCQELGKQEVKSISTLLSSIQKCGGKISIAGEDGLPAMIKYGLIGRVKGIFILRGNEKNEMLTNVAEDFFSILLAICDSRPEGKMQVLENFVLRTCTLIADERISIYVKQEVVRKLNLMLNNVTRDARKKIFSAKEMSIVMSDMGRRILDAGDYDLQVAITEALCRMIPEKQRGELASEWFPMEFVSKAFKGIKDSEFETDCRKFLNQVNGMLGDKRRVFTYPCLSAALDKYELQIPLDENLEEFWIDFNVGSSSISFYVAADDEDHQWETVIIPEEEVDLYSLEEKDSKKLLTIDLKSPVNVGNQEGKTFSLYFDSILDIKDVTRKIYGSSKCKGFSKKQTASVAKTTVHVIFDESGSQVLVPESQVSPSLEEKPKKEKKIRNHGSQQLAGTSRALNKNNSQEKHRGSSSMITASCKRKVSEASVLIPATTRFSTRSPSVFGNTSTPCKGRFKLPLEMISSTGTSSNNAVNGTRTKNCYQEPNGSGKKNSEFCEMEQKVRKSNIRNEAKLPGQQACAEQVLEMMQEAENGATQKQALDEALDIVPDSQPVGRSDKPLLPGVLECSLDKSNSQKKRACSVPKKSITAGVRQKLDLSLPHISHPARVSKTSLRSDFTNEEPDVPSRKETENPKQSKMNTNSKEVTDATKSLISKISDRYKIKTDEKIKTRDSLGFNRPHLNKSFISKEEVQNKSLKTTTFLNITAGHVMDDVYNFNISGFDEPTIKLGMKELHDTELNVHIDPNKKGSADDSKTNTEVKGKKKTRNNQNKKHLFSDTETEFRCDDSKTDISWLQQSNRKSKPQLIDYSRNKTLGKPVSTDKTDLFPEPACHVDKPKRRNACKKKINECKKQTSRTDEMIEQTSRKKLPRRAAVAKNYKEPSSSESECERKASACTSREAKSKPQKHMNGENKDDNALKELQSTSSTKPKTVPTYVQKAFIVSNNSGKQEEIQILSHESPTSPEKMRYAERTSEVIIQEHNYSERSPDLQESTPEKNEMLNFEAAICLEEKHIESTCLTQSPEMNGEKLTFGNTRSSPVLSEVSLLSLTTYRTVSGKHAKGSGSEACDDNEHSGFRHCFTDTPSVKRKLEEITKPIIRRKDKDSISPSPLSVSSGSKAQSWSQERSGFVHESGPTVQTALKRMYHSDTESNSDDTEISKKEKKKGNRRINLKPRKLFKTDDAVNYRVSESVSAISVKEVSVLDGNIWEPGCSTINICQKLQKDITKKVESRSQKMDDFTKQTLRAAHERMTAINRQLHECRIKLLDKFHFALLEELENFEKDSRSLKNMEKEFLNFWKKQTHTFSTYMKNEQQRIQILKSSFEKNICHTVDYEEHIFTSEMHLMKEDLKGLQEKLLKEMQEEELCNVRRGLQAFFPSVERIL